MVAESDHKLDETVGENNDLPYHDWCGHGGCDLWTDVFCVQFTVEQSSCPILRCLYNAPGSAYLGNSDTVSSKKRGAAVNPRSARTNTLWIVIVISELLLPGSTRAARLPTAPSPQVLVGAWQEWAELVVANMRSYRLDGTVLVAYSAKPVQWHSIVDGTRYRWWYRYPRVKGSHQAIWSDTLAVNGSRFSCLEHQEKTLGVPAPLTGANYQNDHDQLQPYLHWFFAQRLPFNVQDFSQYPHLLIADSPVEYQKPLVDYYAENLRNLAVHEVLSRGTNNNTRYRLSLPARLIPSGLVMPCDVEFVEKSGTFVPVNFVTYVGDHTSAFGIRYIIQFVHEARYAGVWFPTVIHVSVAMSTSRSARPSHNRVWVPQKSFGGVYTIAISDVNQEFPPSDFTINFPPGTQLVGNFAASSGYGYPPRRSLNVRAIVIIAGLSIILFAWVMMQISTKNGREGKQPK